LDGVWKYAIESNFGHRDYNSPSEMFNGMIAPLTGFAIRGAIWYQGENNDGNPALYRELLPALIEDWRGHWGQGDFSFLIVQLPNYREPLPFEENSSWAQIREAQALRLPNTGMAVTIDVGEAADIHPKNKQPVGLRLALNALANVYGRKDVAPSGPFYKGGQVEGAQIRVSFDHLGGGLEVRGAALKAFVIAGADRKFLPGDARIDGDTVVVSSPEVSAPVAVRYGWADNPPCNLYNRAGLPASPFRTDDWPVGRD
jgi:sialate O-acetylesterase